MMNKQVTVETVLTAAEFLQFNETAVRRSPAYRRGVIVVYAVLALLAAFCLWKMDWYTVFIPVIAMALFPALQKGRIRRGAARAWKADRRIHDLKTALTFDHEGFTGENAVEKLSVRYEDLWRIYETKTHFYLMLAENRGTAVPKAVCPPELAGLLREKAAAR